MDTIRLKNMQFFAYHGVLPSEAKTGQLFQVDLEIMGDWSSAGNSDNIDDAVNYQKLYYLVKIIVTGKRFNLLEALSEEICSQILTKFNLVKRVKVSIRKPSVPINGILDYAEIEIEREQY